MQRLFLFLFLYSQLFSYSLIDYYRANGIKNIEKEAEKLLKSYKFWFKRLQNLDTDFGYYEDIKYILIVNKSFQSMDLYKNRGDFFQLIDSVDVIVGKNSGEKFFEGDKKTPTGVYRLIDRIEQLDQFYGPLAIVLSYPNLLDRLNGKSGSGIWIHGFPLSGDRELYTKGCVALENSKLIELDRLIDNLNRTIIILEDGQLKKSSKGELALILSSLYQWLDSWKNNRLKKYLSFYSKDFKRYDGHNLKWFKKYKSKLFHRNEKKEIFFTNINISPYPNSKKRRLFLVTFDEKYRSSRINFKGKKELYVEVINGEMKIVVEK